MRCSVSVRANPHLARHATAHCAHPLCPFDKCPFLSFLMQNCAMAIALVAFLALLVVASADGPQPVAVKGGPISRNVTSGPRDASDYENSCENWSYSYYKFRR